MWSTTGRCLFLVVAVVSLFAVVSAQESSKNPRAEPRIWQDSSGKFRTDAVMLKFEKGRVHLQRTDGKVLEVPLGRLSRAAQQYIREEMKRRRQLREW